MLAACLLLAPSCAAPRSGSRVELVELARFVAVNARDVGVALGDARLSLPAGAAADLLAGVSARLSALEAARAAAGTDPLAPLTADEWGQVLVPGLSPGLILGSLVANPRGPDEDSKAYLVRVLVYALQRAVTGGVPGADPS